MTAAVTQVPGRLTPGEVKERSEHRIPIDDAQKIQYVRAWVGGAVIIGGDVVVLAVCIVAVLVAHASSGVATAVLTSAFSAVAAMTSAYFGIRAASNAAQQVTGSTSTPPKQ
jgi:hypothetical protein